MVHTILIVDNEPVQRDLLMHFLQNRLGYRTKCAPSLQEAANLFYADPSSCPDLILYDWPSNSLEVIANFKMLNLRAPLVALVKYGDYEAGTAALNAGAQDFLTKPVAMERIGTTFRNLLQLRDARREVERMRREHSSETSQVQPIRENNVFPALSAFSLLSDDGNIRRMEEIEAEAIRFAMQYYHGRMTEVARRLGIGRSTLYRKLSEFTLRHEHAA